MGRAPVIYDAVFSVFSSLGIIEFRSPPNTLSYSLRNFLASKKRVYENLLVPSDPL